MDRELGTATQPCGTCGAALAVVEIAPGIESTVSCDKCFPKEKAAVVADVLPREFGTVADEDGEEGDDEDGD